MRHAGMLDRIRSGIRERGFHHEPFLLSDREGKAVVALARRLGPLFVPEGLDPKLPVLVTKPTAQAPPSRPFDRPEGIGWHNDFSTAPERPVLSFIWVAEADPAGDDAGAWRVASVASLIKHLETQPQGATFLKELRRQPLPFGYEGDAGPAFYRLLEPTTGDEEGLRFYGRALLEGALARFGQVPASTREVVDRLTRAANAVGQQLPARKGALLVAHNHLSLHDRTAQTTRGDRRRCTVLCFVRTLADDG